jgi:hypothetical protein
MGKWKIPRAVITPIGPSISYVPLTKGLFSLIESWDAEDLGRFNWQAKPDSRKSHYYAARNDRDESGKRIKICIHQQLINPPTGWVADHKNMNRLDNRRFGNLRLANNSQNAQNTRIRPANTSGFKGVCKKGNRWVAQIGRNSKRECLGYFLTPEEAHKAYCEAAELFHGEFRRVA